MKTKAGNGGRSIGHPDDRVGFSLKSMPTSSRAAVQLASAAAQHQFQALVLYGVGTNTASAAASLALTPAESRKGLKRAFIDRGFIEFDSNGFNDLSKYSAAANAIRAKAAALGYGAEANSVEITAVPGGYVGRFGGNDIYASAR
jgi:hypothetical protein